MLVDEEEISLGNNENTINLKGEEQIPITQETHEKTEPNKPMDDLFMHHLVPVKSKHRKNKNKHRPSLVRKGLIGEDLKHVRRILCLDLEAWEYDYHYLLEVGITIWDSRGDESRTNAQHYPLRMHAHHWLVQEHTHLSNGHFVAGRAGGFVFGSTQTLPLKDIHARLLELLAECTPQRTALVGHSVNADLGYLRSAGGEVPRELLGSLAVIADTQLMHIERFPDTPNKTTLETCFREALQISTGSLNNIGRCINNNCEQEKQIINCSLDTADSITTVTYNALSLLGHPDMPTHLHNAGNDAWYTMLLFLHYAGLPCPLQDSHKPSPENKLN